MNFDTSWNGYIYSKEKKELDIETKHQRTDNFFLMNHFLKKTSFNCNNYVAFDYKCEI